MNCCAASWANETTARAARRDGMMIHFPGARLMIRPFCTRRLAAAAACLLPLIAAAADLPKRKPGLWEIATEISMMPGQKMLARQCIDEHTDADLLARSSAQRAQCSPPQISRTGGGFVVDLSCKVQHSTATTHGVFTGSFETSYAGRLETTYAPPLHGMAATTTALEAKWVGPCAAGQKPGDTEVLMPGMRGLNLNEMLKNMPAVR
jgi:hypothetical protein